MRPVPPFHQLHLIGMPGAGKTTLGRALAVAYEVPFLDLDEEITRREGRSVVDIFAVEGEAYFREREAAVLREVLQQPGSFVLATGGGTPCFHQNLEALLKKGLVLYLEVPVPELVRRILHTDATRPLLAAAPTAEALSRRLDETLRARKQFYARAPLCCTAPSCTLEDVRRLLSAYQTTG
ncbi:shikimate kinase [Hymenobacter sediminicola]|uniref:Shikimate kinase n=1 Tax=Hymenobacter sediminicola TaxID=2761579 RepID=A0A7G7W869_9BACT|nr:shikimate kinase [Hymenobacter sediminicola]QNH62562.1 shikimate kinase [Hymenobacter sediminicola]